MYPLLRAGLGEVSSELLASARVLPRKLGKPDSRSTTPRYMRRWPLN
jgi:hypothetical protein